MECLIKECHEQPKTRGLCQSHYLIAIRRIRQGATTWTELIELGMASKGKKLERGEKLIDFDTQLANTRVNGPEWGKKN